MPDAVPAKPARTTYKRELPSPPAIAFSSQLGKRYLAEALADGTAESFFLLIEQFHTQDEPAFCGLASIAMVLNALQVDPKRTWKGPWRWFHEQMLDCCKPLEDIILEGVTLEQAACIARCNGAKTQLVRGPEVSLEHFRERLLQASCNKGELLIVSYTRKTFLQTGDGHFSPIGAYHAASDLALILDVARFKYCPHWVPVSLLYEAMRPYDPLTGKSRGFLSLDTQIQASSVLFSLNITSKRVKEAVAFLEGFGRYTNLASLKAELPEVVSQLATLSSFIQSRSGDGKCHGCGECIQKEAVKQLLQEIHDLQLYPLVTKAVGDASWGECCVSKQSLLSEKLCLCILLGITGQSHTRGPEDEKQVQQSFQLDAYHQILQAELAYVQSQIRELPNLQQAYALEPQTCGCKNPACCCGPAA